MHQHRRLNHILISIFSSSSQTWTDAVLLGVWDDRREWTGKDRAERTSKGASSVTRTQGDSIPSDPFVTVECSSAEVKPEDVPLKSSSEASYSSKDLKDGSQTDQQDASGHSIAETHMSDVCKQAMPLQQSNTVTTSTRAGSSGSASPTQPAKNGFFQICEVIPESTCPKFKEAVCCNSHFPHGAIEDTFAAYCHPQPIPAPAQLLPHLVGMEESYKGQVSAGNLLHLPRLISSVSETGLDGKRLLRCCNLDCSWPGPLRPVGPQQWVDEKTKREVGTMTTKKELRDVGVQVGQDSEEHPQHVFPEVCLVEEKTNASGKVASKSQKSPVKEVKWDAEGMTWEVYGASVDPEELGLAIQKHLEVQIKETKGIAAKLSRQNTTTSQHSSGSTQRRKKGLLGLLRHPGCCSRTTGAVD
ncbi:hypothetical protein cypCar_00006884 [Cyprinus carpio]|nr:hypothetical protein cypCar_00006884 [Cyprinus carpio]